ncbi:MAG: hypothetical protein RL060_711 [Bacteroidota bacterium]|jgi:hypothetical protein
MVVGVNLITKKLILIFLIICFSCCSFIHANILSIDSIGNSNFGIKPYLYANTSNKFNVVIWDIGTYIIIDNAIFCDIAYRHTNNDLGLIGLGLGVRLNIMPIKKYVTPFISYKKHFTLNRNNYSNIHELMTAFEFCKFKTIKPLIRFGYWYVENGSYGLFVPAFSIGIIYNLYPK